MSLVKWKPENALIPSFTSLFDSFFGKDTEDWFNTMMKGTTVPAVNIREFPMEFKLTMAVPGMKKEDFKLEVDKGYLTISSERKEEKEEKEGRFTKREFNYSSFVRSFLLPDNIKSDNIKAEYVDGVLNVMIPKLKEEMVLKATKTIPVS